MAFCQVATPSRFGWCVKYEGAGRIDPVRPLCLPDVAADPRVALEDRMDIRTGQTYETREDALAAGVPASDIAEVTRMDDSVPTVKFASGPFKDRTYKRMPNGQLVRCDK